VHAAMISVLGVWYCVMNRVRVETNYLGVVRFRLFKS
jgi:hypothetical protein